MTPVTLDVQCLKFGLPDQGSGARRIAIRIERQQDVERLRDGAHRTALLVRSADLPAFRALAGLVVDRRKKDPRKSLSGYLLGQGKEKVPLIEGSYASSVQLKRSLRELLAKAAGDRDSRLFVVGADARLFQELWEAAAGIDATQHHADPSTTAATATGDDSEVTETEFYEELKRRSPHAPSSAVRFVGTSGVADRIRTLIAIASQSADAVLVTGESGTGKEVVAREIHRLGARSSESFIPVNCGAIPGELFESELFGHRRGSFTGAIGDKDGLWKKADRGTLFLDEIGDLAPTHQAKILRALEEGCIRPVGATEASRVDARIVSATNRNLTAMIAAGTFREDLYYRLNSFVIPTSPLREHDQDVPVLAASFWQEIAGDGSAALPREVLAALAAYRWPGNARELKSTLRQLHAMFPGPDLGARHLAMVFLHLGQQAGGLPEPAGDREVERFRGECLQQLRRVMDVLQAVQRAARSLAESGPVPKPAVEALRRAFTVNRDDLDRLRAKPLLLGGEECYEAVTKIKDALDVLLPALRGQVAAARHLWNAGTADTLAAAVAAVFKAVERCV